MWGKKSHQQPTASALFREANLAAPVFLRSLRKKKENNIRAHNAKRPLSTCRAERTESRERRAGSELTAGALWQNDWSALAGRRNGAERMKREMGVADASMKCARVRACAQITGINTKSREEDQYGGERFHLGAADSNMTHALAVCLKNL